VLAARLRELQHANVVRRRLLPPPASSMVYELTGGGRELSRIVLKLEQWGERSLAAVSDATKRSRRQGKQSDAHSRSVR
jgi:DNA-binding HxlR family transcriptional regulator